MKLETRRERRIQPIRRFVVAISWLFLWAVVALSVLALTPLAYYYGTPLRDQGQPQPSDVIVLLSHGQLDDQWLSPEGAQRTWAALRLYKLGFAPVIISSGSSHGGLDQAGLQAKWLMLAGVPSQAILIERQSSRTYESGLEVVKILREHGWQSAVIVTSELDVPRVRGVFRKLGCSKLSFQQVPEFGPPSGTFYYHSGWRAFYHSTYEYVGLILYKWKGWI